MRRPKPTHACRILPRSRTTAALSNVTLRPHLVVWLDAGVRPERVVGPARPILVFRCPRSFRPVWLEDEARLRSTGQERPVAGGDKESLAGFGEQEPSGHVVDQSRSRTNCRDAVTRTYLVDGSKAADARRRPQPENGRPKACVSRVKIAAAVVWVAASRSRAPGQIRRLGADMRRNIIDRLLAALGTPLEGHPSGKVKDDESTFTGSCHSSSNTRACTSPSSPTAELSSSKTTQEGSSPARLSPRSSSKSGSRD